jgi:hypothetical protein
MKTTTMQMSVADWIKVQDNPRQRDTERHAARATHLMTPQPTHTSVAAAQMPNGKLVKLDGHTRAYLWKHSLVAPPKSLEVTIIPVKSLDEAMEFYTHYDNQKAVETATDRTFGGFREIGFKPQSPLLRGGKIGSALKLSWEAVYGFARDKRPKNTYAMINEFAAEILALDELGLANNAAGTSIIAAFILSYRKHGDSVTGFWSSVFANAGTKANGQMDGVQAVNEIMLARKGTANIEYRDTLGRVLAALEKWLLSDTMQAMPRPLDLPTYLTTKQKPMRVRRVT